MRSSFLALAALAPLSIASFPPDAASASPPPVVSGPRVSLPATREVRLPNGALFLLAEKHDVPLIAFEGYLRGGASTDPPGKEGVAALTAEMLRKGAGRRSAQEIAAATDGVGAALATGAGLEVSWISGEFMARDQKLMLDLLKSILREPTFPDSELTKLKSQTIESIRAAKDDPLSVLGLYASAFFYDGHPYGRPVSGDESTISALTREDVLASYRATFGADRLIFAMVGDFDAASMESKLRGAFASWGGATGSVPAIPQPKRASGRHVYLIDKPDATQTYFWIGNLGVARGDPDRVAIDVINTAFGGRYTSMLNTALRIKSGLTYGARSRLSRLTKPGTVAIVSYTKIATTQKAIDLALETLVRLHASGLDETTLRSATQYIQGQYPPDFETNAQVAGALAEMAFYGFPASEVSDYPAKVGEVRSTAALAPIIRRVYPAAENLTFVVIGNARAIRSVLSRYGSVHETTIDRPLLRAIRETKHSRAR